MRKRGLHLDKETVGGPAPAAGAALGPIIADIPTLGPDCATMFCSYDCVSWQPTCVGTCCAVGPGRF